MTNFKIFGQEPAAALGVIEGVLALLLTFGVPGLSQNADAAIVAAVAAVFGLVAAWTTKNGVLSALVGVTKAILVLGAAYSFQLTDPQNGALIAAITLVGGFFLREKNSAVTTPITNASPGTFSVAA